MSESTDTNDRLLPAEEDGAARASADDGVSVVVPSYNHARYVGQALRSVFLQTLAPLELLVIDDGSKDDSVRVVERILRDCPFPCELVARENRGLCATLNEGFARARGRFFAYLGSDDAWLPGFLEARVRALRSRPRAVLAYGHAYTADADGRLVDCTTDWARYRDGDARRMLLEALAPLSPTVVYRRAALARHRWNEETRLEDYELYLRLSAEGDFAFDPRVLSAWRWHGRNTSADLDLMLREQLDAQRRAAPALGLTRRELEKFQARLRFRKAEEFVRHGRKLRALRLLPAGFRGTPSARDAALMLARLLLPRPLLALRRRRANQRAAARYGTLEEALSD
ncbi:MAG TPA: glycosyltransferase [Pyrinomonadaceae bacterium]|nr:glycosyltransferase [Pyrinomonadaceae bacterium]